MKPSEALAKANPKVIRRIVRENAARNPRVFGSVARGEDTESSDLDILVDRTEKTSLIDLGRLQIKLGDLLGVDVDVRTPGNLPERFRSQVVAEARAI